MLLLLDTPRPSRQTETGVLFSLSLLASLIRFSNEGCTLGGPSPVLAVLIYRSHLSIHPSWAAISSANYWCRLVNMGPVLWWWTGPFLGLAQSSGPPQTILSRAP